MLEHEEISIEDENNKFEEVNYIRNDTFSNKINKGFMSIGSDDLLGSEEVLINLKKEIETVKKRNEAYHLKKESTQSINNNITSNKNIDKIEYNNKIQTKSDEDKENIIKELNNDLIEFNINIDKNIFEYSGLNFLTKKNDETDVNINWKEFDKNFNKLIDISNSKKGYEYIELNQMALRLIQEIDFDEMGLELSLNFNLIGSSQIFIFTRCFVNKGINESGIFDDLSYNVGKKDIFNKYTSLIKINKDMKTKSCFITFGTYYNDINKNNKLCHKFFLKRQLIDYSVEKKDNNYYNSKEDATEFNVIINDFGEETINSRIFLNDNKKPNEISGSFFIPINKKAQIMVFGMGTSVRMKEIKGKIFNKRNESLKNLIKFESENNAPKNCDCCVIV